MLLILHAQSALVFNQDLTSVVLNNLTSNNHKIQKIIHSVYLPKRLKQWTKEEIIGSMTWHGIVPMFPHMSATAQHVWYTCANIKTTALTELTNYTLKVEACFVADVSWQFDYGQAAEIPAASPDHCWRWWKRQLSSINLAVPSSLRDLDHMVLCQALLLIYSLCLLWKQTKSLSELLI